MKLLFDFFPVLLFFLGFKLFGIYYATVIAIIASFTQVALYWMKNKKFEKMHIITFVLILILGGATLIFHDPVFIKWKPTGVYWVSAIAFYLSQFIGKKNLIQTLMDQNISLTKNIWARLNAAWGTFFLLMGVFNIYIAYNYDTNTWVNFKFFGGLGLTLIFVFLQAIYLSRHIKEENLGQLKNSES